MTMRDKSQLDAPREIDPTDRPHRWLRRRPGWWSLREYTVVFAALGLFALLSIVSGPFLTLTNQLNVLDQWSLIGIIACGATIVIIAGGFDLSVDAVFALSGVVSAYVAVTTNQPVIALLAGVATGLALGVFNGLLVTFGRINPFVATLATSVMFLGLANLITGGSLIVVDNEEFSALGNGMVGPFTVQAIVFMCVAVVGALLLSRTVLGNRYYAVGGSPESAFYAGIPVHRVQISSYAISGLSAGIAGVLASSRNSVGTADIRVDLAFTAITAIVIGGVSIFGGRGTMIGAIFGLWLMALIGNGFNLLTVDPSYQQLLLGTIIVIAVAADAWSRKKSG